MQETIQEGGVDLNLKESIGERKFYWQNRYERALRYPDLISTRAVSRTCIPLAIRDRLQEEGFDEESI